MLKLVLISLTAVFFIACSGEDDKAADSPAVVGTTASVSTSAAVATAVPVATSAELLAIAEQMFPQRVGQFGVEFVPCGLQSCPITERLRQRFSSITGVKANMICRCQNFSDTRTITVEATPTGGIAHVVLFRDSWKMDLIIVRSGDKLLVDDTACTGKPGTSIHTSTTPCSS